MATIQISEEVLSELIFDNTRVHIRYARVSSRGVLELTIDGPEVPECDRVLYEKTSRFVKVT